jgi:antitoxin (DNA-binding transcriptional repressor) of toxin-antitoxin stability system
MAVHGRPIEITIAALHADTEGIIRDLPESQGVMIVSDSGEPVAWLAPLAPANDLTPEQVRTILQVSHEAENADPSELIAHEDFMRDLEEEERRLMGS